MPPTPKVPSSEFEIAELVKKNLQLENKLVEMNAMYMYTRAVDDCLKVTVKLEEHQKNKLGLSCAKLSIA